MNENILTSICHALILILETQRMNESNRLLPLAINSGSGSEESKELIRSWDEHTEVIKSLMNFMNPIGMCKGGCKHPECLSIEYREISEGDRLKLVPYAKCSWCPDAGNEKEQNRGDEEK